MQGVDWPEITLQQAEAALAEIQAALAPADERALAALLYEIWLATAKQSTATEDQQATAAVYVRELRQWPGDVALAVLRQARRSCRWWPPLADLSQACGAQARKRLALLASLQARIEELRRPALPAPALQRMPRNPARAASFWSVDKGRNVERLAQLRGIAYRQARAMLVYAKPAELLDLEAEVRAANGAPARPAD